MSHLRLLLVGVFTSLIDATIWRAPIHVQKLPRSEATPSFFDKGGQQTPLQAQILDGQKDGRATISLNAGDAHEIPIMTFENMVYYTEVSLGSPPQSFRALVDISWSDFFVTSSSCTAPDCSKFFTYHSSWSKTHISTSKRGWFQHPFVQSLGLVSGDTLTVAGIEIPEQYFHEATQVFRPPLFPWMVAVDAILGLGPNNDLSPAATKISNAFVNMKERGLLEKNVISFCLGEWDPKKGPRPGEILFGGIDEALYNGELTTVPLTQHWDPPNARAHYLNGTWQSEARSMTISNSTSNVTFELPGYTARFDTSIPFIILPRKFAKQLMEIAKPRHNEQYNMVVDCDSRSVLPNITFNLGGKDLAITPFDYIIQAQGGSDSWECLWTIGMARQDWPDMIALGAAFLRAFYTVLDADEGTISFGKPWYR